MKIRLKDLGDLTAVSDHTFFEWMIIDSGPALTEVGVSLISLKSSEAIQGKEKESGAMR